MTLYNNTNDRVVWVDKKGRDVKFTIRRAWKDFNEDSPKVKWCKAVWYT